MPSRRRASTPKSGPKRAPREATRARIERRRRQLELELSRLRRLPSPRGPPVIGQVTGVRTRPGDVLGPERFGERGELEVVGVRFRDRTLRFAPRQEPPPAEPATEPPAAVEPEVITLQGPETSLAEFLDDDVAAADIVDPETVLLARAPAIPEAWKVADATLEQVERAIRLVEEQLARLAEKERLLTERGHRAVGRPHQVDEYTLYAQGRRRADGTLGISYRFRDAPTRDAVPAPLPRGYRIRRHPTTQRPFLVREDRFRR